MYKIAIKDLNTLFSKIAEEKELILPIKKAGQYNFGVYEEGADIDGILNNKTVKSGKDAFFPQFSTDEWVVADREKHDIDEKHQYRYSFTDYVRK